MEPSRSRDSARPKATEPSPENPPASPPPAVTRYSSDTLPVDAPSTLPPNEKTAPTAGPPPIPFTWPQGKSALILYVFLFVAFIEVCIIPLVLFYALRYGTDIANWITFAIITAIWGFNIYFQLSMRSWYLFRREDYRPLGATSKWAFDLTAWTGMLSTGAAVVLLIIGTVPTDVWIRVCAMAAPAIMLVDGFIGLFILHYAMVGWRAPFRLSSTARGEFVKPGVYYFVEDVLAVDGKGGRALREAMALRYEASPRFRKMMFVQSVFWVFPMLVLAAGLTVIAVVHQISRPVVFGVCSGVPWVWAVGWGLISWAMVKRDLRIERQEWPKDQGVLDGAV